MWIERVIATLAAVYGGRSWLVVADVLQAATPTVQRLRSWGAPRCFVIAARAGTGTPPSPEDCETVVLGLSPLPMMDAILAAEEAVRALSAEVQAAVDSFDPAEAMRVIGPIFSDGRPVAGRTFWGARPAMWRALEDKVIIDGVWDEVGIPRAPAEIVRVEQEALRAAAARLDAGRGTVWAGDATRGFHGGATFTCRVASEADARRAEAILTPRCVRARVMPYLSGTPCSIHGIVFPDYVIALRPAEMVTLHRQGGTGFLYARAATFWDPPPVHRVAMREMVRRVGAYLRAKVGYRGAFTIDGVLTADGFRPTELNPRVGAALGLMVPSFPFSFLHDALVEEVPAQWDPVRLEAELLALADSQRNGMIGFVCDTPFTDTVRQRLRFDRGAWREAAPEEPVDGELSIGPGPSGGYVTMHLVSERTPVGPSVASRAAALVRYTDRLFETSIGPVGAATG